MKTDELLLTEALRASKTVYALRDRKTGKFYSQRDGSFGNFDEAKTMDDPSQWERLMMGDRRFADADIVPCVRVLIMMGDQ